jgi:Lysyl oxidase
MCRARPARRVPLVLLFLLSFATAFVGTNAVRGVGQPLYPDLRTEPPAGLFIDTPTMSDGRTHYLVRFDTVVENRGGRLEIVADLAHSRDLFQNVYDARVGGNLVSHTKVASDLIYHPQHNHFHFQDFASYVLLKKDAKGVYRLTTRRGSKTSFCILDTIRVDPSGASDPYYTVCNNKRQGLSSGWADVYNSGLDGQWIDFGTSRPVNGDYAIQSTADPKNKLKESNDANNSATTYFTIHDGELELGEQLPTCTLSPNNGPVGTPVQLFCAKMSPGDTIDIRWGGPSTAVLSTVTVDADHKALASLVVPPSTLGTHYVYATNRRTGGSTLGLFMTTAALAIGPTSGPVGSQVRFAATGFVANETVTVRYTTVGSTTTLLASLTADARGSASGVGTIPASILGAHTVEAKGGTSGAAAAASFGVVPSLRLIPTAGQPGANVGVSLRGFMRYETVTLTLADDGGSLASIRTSSTGSATATAFNSFPIPRNLAPGDYEVLATGAVGGETASAVLTVAAAPRTAGAVEVESPTPTTLPTATPTSTPTSEPTATAAPPTATATVEPTATETPTAEPSPTETPTTEPAPPDDQNTDTEPVPTPSGTPAA